MAISPQHRTSLLTGLILAALFSVGFRGEIVDRVIATVDDQVITLVDLHWLVRYRGFRPPEDPAARQDFYRDVLGQLINQKLILRESARTPFVKVQPEEIERFTNAYAARFESWADFENQLRAFGMEESDFRELMERQIAVNKFIELRFEPFVIVLPDEIEAYYREEYVPELERMGQQAPSLAVVEETIRQLLTVQRTTSQLEQWLQSTQARVRIRESLLQTPIEMPNIPPGFRDEVRMIPDPFSKNSSSNR